jgi:hypothetical protein
MKKSEIFLFILWFLIFFSLIFLINITFFWDNSKNDYEETVKDYEWYIENSESWALSSAKIFWDNFTKIEKKETESDDVKKRYDEILNDYKSSVVEKEVEIQKETREVNYNFDPEILKTDLLKSLKLSNIYKVTNSLKIPSEISLNVNFFKDTWKSRWNYKENSVRLFWVNDLSKKELLAVFIHEFWHYFDIDFFDNELFSDKSNDFYNISWEQTKVLKWWQSIKDFVSGYAMTNKYEDFAESFIYYVVHNWDFLEKSKKSEYMQKKYNFFSNNLFVSQEFQNTNFTNWKLLDYYRDTTKIDYFLENLLSYLEK